MRIIFTSLLVVAFLAWSAPGCKQKVRSYMPTPTLIEGWIRTSDSESLEIYLAEKKDTRCESHSDGHFLLTPTLSEAGIYHLQIGKTETIQLFIIPGKRIQVTIEMQQKHSTPNFTGDLSNENNYLSEYTSQQELNFWLKTDSVQKMEEAFFTTTVEEFTTQILAYQQKWQQEKGAFDSDFASIMSEELSLLSARLKLDYANGKMAVNDTLLSLSDTYDSFLQNIEIESEAHLMVPSYPAFLFSYVSYRLAQDTSLQKMSRVDGLLNTAEKILQPSDIQDLAFFEILKKGMKTDINETVRLVPSWQQKFKNPNFITEITKLQFDSKDLLKGVKVPDHTFETLRGSQTSLGKFKDKIVLLVVWESTSQSSISELNILGEILKNLKPGRKPEVLFINVDQNKYAWKSAVRKYKIRGTNMYLPTKGRQQFLNHYKIEKTPALLLLGKGGIMLNATAPLPSTGRLQLELSGL